MTKKHLRFTVIAIIGSSFIGLALALVFTELYYRRIEKSDFHTAGCEWAADPDIGFVNKPNATCHRVTAEFDMLLQMNSDGNASPEFDPDPAACNVMGLGDSHTVAVGVSNGQAWPNVAGDLLRPRFDRKLQFINMGVAGYSVGQYYQKMTKYLPKYKPRHVVMAFTLASDAYDIRPPAYGGFVFGAGFTRPYFDVENDSLVMKPAPIIVAVPKGGAPTGDASHLIGNSTIAGYGAVAKKLKSFLFENFALYRATYRGAIGQYGVRLLRHVGVDPWLHVNAVLARQLDPTDQHSWLIVEKLLERFQTELTAKKIGFTVVVIPYLPQAYDSVWNRTFAGEEKYDRFAGNKRLNQICQRYGIDCLDVTDSFIQKIRSNGRWLNFKEDAHPTPEGQAVIGRLVAEHLREKLSHECVGQ